MVLRLLEIDSGDLEQLLRTFPGSQINSLPSRLHLLFFSMPPHKELDCCYSVELFFYGVRESLPIPFYFGSGS